MLDQPEEPKMKIQPFATLLAILTTGCAPQFSVTYVASKSYDSKPSDCSIQIFTQVPNGQKFEELAILDCLGGMGDTNLNSILPALKSKACSLGADAILIKSIEDAVPGKSALRVFASAIKFQ
jgi:hypothetical protein